jgi:hypothetical protein
VTDATEETEEVVTLDDLTEDTEDTGGASYEQYVSPEEPDHDPFGDYPDGLDDKALDVGDDEVPAVALFGIPMGVAAKLAHNLDVRRQKIWACWGTGVKVYWIGDASHQATCSDHNKDSTGVVHAIDVMVTGTRAKSVVDQMLAHNGDLQYVIHNRVIWSRSSGWKPRKYTGKNPHTDHVHGSGKHGSAHSAAATCTGYDLAAQASTPVFDLCPKPKPPAPKPPVKPVTHAPGTRILSNRNPDMTGPDVLFVQKFIGPRHAGAADGKYGGKTAAGVRWYQAMRGIHVDGIVTPATWKQMGVKWHG